jgi:hypothetical protein
MLHLNYYKSCNTTLSGTWVNIIGPSMTMVKKIWEDGESDARKEYFTNIIETS